METGRNRCEEGLSEETTIHGRTVWCNDRQSFTRPRPLTTDTLNCLGILLSHCSLGYCGRVVMASRLGFNEPIRDGKPREFESRQCHSFLWLTRAATNPPTHNLYSSAISLQVSNTLCHRQFQFQVAISPLPPSLPPRHPRRNSGSNQSRFA